MYHASSYTNTLESTFLLYYKKKGFLLRGIPLSESSYNFSKNHPHSIIMDAFPDSVNICLKILQVPAPHNGKDVLIF